MISADNTAVCLCNAGYHVSNDDSKACIKDEAPTNPCKDVNCSENGTCLVTADNTAVCLCDTGYHASIESPAECIQDKAPANPCDGQSCGGNGVCVPVNDSDAVCVCKNGFYNTAADPMMCALEPCQYVTCGGHGTCHTIQDKAVCQCQDGYYIKESDPSMCVNGSSNACALIDCGMGVCVIGEDDKAHCQCDDNAILGKVGNQTICVENPCLGNNCSGHGTCTNINGADAVCQCASGFHATVDAPASCVADSGTNPCNDVTCSDHGMCIVDSDNNALCVCEDGYANTAPTECTDLHDVNLNGNYMRDAYETTIDQGKDCKTTHKNGCAEGFCDSFLDYQCSTPCTSDDQCIDDTYFCRSDGRCAPKTFETVWELPTVLYRNYQMVFFPCSGTNGGFTIDWGDGTTKKYTSCSDYISHDYYSFAAGEKKQVHIKVTGNIKWGENSPNSMKLSTNTCLTYLNSSGACTNTRTYGPNNYQTAYCSYVADNYCDIGSAYLNYYMLGVEEEGATLKDGKVDMRAGRIGTLVEIVSYGPADIDAYAFYSTTTRLNLATSKDIPNARTLNCWALFRESKATLGNLNRWDTSNVTNMNYMFYSTTSFNQPIGNWDTSNVTDMNDMFYNATSFNQPIGNWDTSNVTSFSHMFYNATSFNQPIGNWNTSKVKVISNMFSNATSFDQSLENWDVSMISTTDHWDYVNAFWQSGLSEANWNKMKDKGWSKFNKGNLGIPY